MISLISNTLIQIHYKLYFFYCSIFIQVLLFTVLELPLIASNVKEYVTILQFNPLIELGGRLKD